MERYITSEEADTLLTTFCQLGDLDDFDSELVKEALNNPKSFCLKILREGGAEGNLFGEEIIPKLEEMKTNKDVRKMYILMKRIEPDTKPNVLGQFYFLKCSAEDRSPAENRTLKSTILSVFLSQVYGFSPILAQKQKLT